MFSSLQPPYIQLCSYVFGVSKDIFTSRSQMFGEHVLKQVLLHVSQHHACQVSWRYFIAGSRLGRNFQQDTVPNDWLQGQTLSLSWGPTRRHARGYHLPLWQKLVCLSSTHAHFAYPLEHVYEDHFLIMIKGQAQVGLEHSFDGLGTCLYIWSSIWYLDTPTPW